MTNPVNDSANAVTLAPDDFAEGNLEQQTPGALLRAARLNRDLSLEEISAEINVPVKKLEALENNQFEQMVSPTFVKGYLRSFCRCLEINPETVIECYDAYVDKMSEAGVTVTRPTIRMQSLEKPFPEWSWAIIFGVLVFLVLAVYFLWGQDWFKGSESSSTANPVTSSTPIALPTESSVTSTVSETSVIETPELQTDQNPNPAVDSGDAVTTGDAVIDSSVTTPVEPEGPAVNAEPDLSSGSESAPTAELDTAASTPSSAPLKPGQAELLFTFSDDSWVEVSDADGVRIHQGISKLGDSLSVVGLPPFSIMLGNVRAVALTLNDEPVAIQPTPGRNALRFSVGADL